jgi:hypothetical protein
MLNSNGGNKFAFGIPTGRFRNQLKVLEVVHQRPSSNTTLARYSYVHQVIGIPV